MPTTASITSRREIRSAVRVAGLMNLDASSQQVYCTPLPYSEWHLITILPFGVLNETVETLDQSRTNFLQAVLYLLLVVNMRYGNSRHAYNGVHGRPDTPEPGAGKPAL